MDMAKVVRFEVTEDRVKLRLWLEDPDGGGVSLAELELTDDRLADYVRAIGAERNRSAQLMMGFDA